MSSTDLKFSHAYVGYTPTVPVRDEYSCSGILNTGETVGYCKYYCTDPASNTVFIEYIYIHTKFRRQGYGTRFVQELQKKHTLDWDNCFTPAGEKWYKSLLKRKIVRNFSQIHDMY